MEKIFSGSYCHYSLFNPLNSQLGRLEEYLRPFEVGDVFYEVVPYGKLVSSSLVGLKYHWTILPATHPFRKLEKRERIKIRALSFLGSNLRIPEATCSLMDGNHWHHQYFHWFFDYLPRVLVANDYQKKVGKKVFFLVPKDINDWQKASLQLLGHGAESLIPTDQNAVNSYISCRVLLAAPSSRAHGLKGAPFDCMSPAIVKKLANTLLSNAPTLDKSPVNRARIFISRNDATSRRIINEQEVIDFLQKYGFYSVSLTGMSLVDQINLFSNASHIVAVHGAGLTNLLFASNATVIELFSDRHGIRPDYFQLSLIKSLKYCYHVFPSLNDDNDIYVALPVFKELLDSSI